MANKKSTFSIEWDINEKERFKELIKNVSKRSKELSKKMKEKVKQNLLLISENPKIFEEDSHKTNNDGSFRKFQAIQIRIVYKIENDMIIIVRVRHARTEPKEY